MVYIDDEHVKDPAPPSMSLRSFYIPTAPYLTPDNHMKPVTPIVIDHETDCASVNPDMTKCGRITDGKTCYLTSECYWDPEFQQCTYNSTYFYSVLASGLLVPIVFIVCYYLGNNAQMKHMWSELPNMLIVYMFSVFFATCAILYMISDVIYLKAYQHQQAEFANPLLVLFIGTMSIPIFRLLWILRGYSQNWVTVGLLATSGGLLWFTQKYMRQLSPSKNRLGMASVYYALFHVLLIDNFLRWWMVFSTSKAQ